MPEKHEPIKIPARLSPGDTIGIIAPAGPYDHDAFARGTGCLEELGFKVLTPPGLLLSLIHISEPTRLDLASRITSSA